MYTDQRQMQAQQQAQQQQIMMMNLRALQLQKLQMCYPETALLKEGPAGQEFRVPLKIGLTNSILFVKITIDPMFPQTKPIIQVMSRVTHPTIEPNTYCYKGQAIMQWNVNSQLDTLIQTINAEFSKQPPMPQQVTNPAGVPQAIVPQQQQFVEPKKVKYAGEVVSLQKPSLMQLKQQIMQMPPSQLDKLLADNKALEVLYLQTPEVEAMKQKTNQLAQDLSIQSQENIKLRSQLQSLLDKNEQQYPIHYSLKDTNDQLKSEMVKAQAFNGIEKIVSCLKKKLMEAEDKGKQTEKAYLRQEIDSKKMMTDYINQRKEYHKILLLKTKVVQN